MKGPIQRERVQAAMKAGEWYTLKDLEYQTGYAVQSISARLRDLRKPANGGLRIERRKIKDTNEFEYRMVA